MHVHRKTWPLKMVVKRSNKHNPHDLHSYTASDLNMKRNLVSLSWADGDRGPVLWSSGQWHVWWGEGQIHGLQSPKKLDSARVCPESFPDHGESCFILSVHHRQSILRTTWWKTLIILIRSVPHFFCASWRCHYSYCCQSANLVPTFWCARLKKEVQN